MTRPAAPVRPDLDVDRTTILDVLSFVRPHGSEGEAEFVAKYLAPLNPTVVGQEGLPLAYIVSTAEPTDAPYLFSSHTDTVHRLEHGKHQLVNYDPKTDTASSAAHQPLGADDAAGMWLMLEMIKANVPGTYVFHRAEEVGGIGSDYMAKHYCEYLAQFRMAVAFDRRGTCDVITHQGYGRCASDAFAEALADALNDLGLLYMPSDGGVFTDTANYTELIPECTNVSCGYDREHTAAETLDIGHLIAMRDALVQLDWSALPIERDPNDTSPDWVGRGSWATGYEDNTLADLYVMTRNELATFAYEDPDSFADLVYELINA